VLDALITEYGAVAQTLLPRHTDEGVAYDVIVVGSGAGGGVLASALADEGANVLVLEAGSLLFETHVGNLPRQLPVGQFDKNVWHLWRDFAVKNYTNVPGSDFAGGQGFNLGGRSIFWGALIPRLTDWQLHAWPAEVRNFLLSGGYEAAEARLNAAQTPSPAFQQDSTAFLDATLSGWIAADAPMAIQYVAPAHWMLPAGLFSSADPLLEDALRAGSPAPTRPLIVNLNHAVWNVTTDGARATGVRCFDLLDGVERTYRADTVVLAAGTIESAKVALQSGLTDPANLIGKGITDHTIRYRHFTVPPHHAHSSTTDSAKVVLQHPAATADAHAFDIVVELGTELNQGRYTDPGNLAGDERIRAGWMMCEIVFQYLAELEPANFVRLDGAHPSTPVAIDMARADPPAELMAEADGITETVLAAYDARPVLGEEGDWPTLRAADLGGVAHEVGTLRMTASGDGVIDANLKFLAYDNLYACDNSVFPCSPAANPTLTLAALALRLADHLTHP
jgi:choline dehydrogenase-like flavoprotein